jgi:hypothetical protein
MGHHQNAGIPEIPECWFSGLRPVSIVSCMSHIAITCGISEVGIEHISHGKFNRPHGVRVLIGV